MVGAAGIIFVLLPESPWWLVSKGRNDAARSMLKKCHPNIKDQEVQEQIDVINATVAHERIIAEQNAEVDALAVFRGRNLIRFFISSWPKVVQQFVGLSVFNTYAVYFCTLNSASFRSRSVHRKNEYVLTPHQFKPQATRTHSL